MTDSVNCVAFFDPVSFDINAQVSSLDSTLACLWFLRAGYALLLRGRRLLLRRRPPSSRPRRRRGARRGAATAGIASAVVGRRVRPVETAVVLGGAEDPLHVVLRLGKRDVVDELVALEAWLGGNPLRDAARAGVVGRQREVQSAELLHQIGEVRRPHLDVRLRGRQHARARISAGAAASRTGGRWTAAAASARRRWRPT